jgi:hypothetical protein
MKRINSLVVGLVITICVLFFASANQSAARPPQDLRSNDGVLRLKHSPLLGINVPIDVQIDGVEAGAFAKGHVFERYLAPGRHEVSASRSGQPNDSFYGTLLVRPGETYSFVVSCTVNQVMLEQVDQFD